MSEANESGPGRDELGLQIGAKVKALRAERGLSGRKLAAAADVSQPFLSQLEAGRTSVAIATLYRLASALDVKPSDLLPDPPTDTEVEVLRAAELDQMPVSELPNATTARTASSSAIEVQCPAKRPRTSGESALRASGRSMVSTVMPSSRSSRRRVMVDVVPMG